MKVCHYRCFDADQRISMQIYADTLASALQADVDLSCFKPDSRLEQISNSSLVMRYLRYLKYPALAKRWVTNTEFDIHHVLDHGYAHLLPKLQEGNLGAGKTCITVHDLIPLLTWKGLIPTGQQRPVVAKPYLNIYSLKFIDSFDHIVAPSQSTANDLQQHLDIKPDKISLIPPIIADHFQPVSTQVAAAFGDQFGIDPNIKWILISGREYYKNHTACLAVLDQLNKHGSASVKMLKIGLNSPEFDQQVASLGLGDKVKTLFLEDPKQLPKVYALVDCLLFPSFYEGFGMPIAEALACGTPVVCSDTGSLPEVGGDLALRCAPDDLLGLCQAVERALFDPVVKADVLRRGGDWVAQWRAETVKQSIVTLYKKLLS